MTDFAAASRQAQLLRLRRLALSALSAWGLDVRRVTHLTYWENATWRVDAREGRFLLRVHRPGYRTASQIDAELRWLEALLAVGLEVQRPVAARDGARVVWGAAPGVPERRAVSLLSWVEGRFRPRSARPVHCRRLGEMIARLHAASEAWNPGAWDRPRIDERDIFRLPARPGVPEVDGLLTEAEWADWERAGRRLHGVMAGLGRGPAVYGPIHADLHLHNVVFRGAAALPIDFDDAGWGYYACDLSIPQGRLPGLSEPERCRGALLEGYAAVREPPSAEAVEAFEYCDAVMTPRWIAARLEMARVREMAPDLLRRCTARLRRWLAGATRLSAPRGYSAPETVQICVEQSRQALAPPV